MLKKVTKTLSAGIILMLFGFTMVNAAAAAKEVLKYSSSAQVREAFGSEGLNAFAAETGIETDLFVGSSASALHRLMNGFSDIASTVERLNEGSEMYGYKEIPFCKAPLIVITNVKTPVKSVTSTQLREVFSGMITNWKELGGPDESIVVVVPGKHTGAFKNFSQLALKRTSVKYDFMTYRSTDVVALVKRLPWSISFISRGAHTVDAAIKTMKVDDIAPDEPNYPYFQIFSFVTKGEPSSAARQLIDFAFSEKARAIMRKNGMEPLSR
jgi:phosphate transport system substrate-binding protein